jgi:phosphoethanolamine N-methyltransferase
MSIQSNGPLDLAPGDSVTAAFLEGTQYNLREILEDEHLFGYNYYNIGGEAENLRMLDLAGPIRPRRILDVGCGLAGPARLMARRYEVEVDGVDMSRVMIQLARERLAKDGMADRVRVYLADILGFAPDLRYDLIFSNCVFLHIHAKARLLQHLHELLTPAGLLLFGDFCRGQDGPEMQAYIAQYGYHILTLPEWDEQLAAAGFTRVAVEDATYRHRQGCAEALARPDISAEWLGVLTRRMIRIDRGQHRWGVLCYARA